LELRAPNGTTYSVSKQHAFAIISGHPRSSKDRSLRVQTMSRFVSLRLQQGGSGEVGVLQ
jgi:hypothetical protein